MRQAQGRGLRGDARSAEVFGRGMLQHPVDDARAVEAGHHRRPPRHRRRLEPSGLLHPAHEQLQLRPARGQRVHAAVGAPIQEPAQIRGRVRARQAGVAGQERRHRHPQSFRRGQHLAGRRRHQNSGHPGSSDRHPCQRRRSQKRPLCGKGGSSRGRPCRAAVGSEVGGGQSFSETSRMSMPAVGDRA